MHYEDRFYQLVITGICVEFHFYWYADQKIGDSLQANWVSKSLVTTATDLSIFQNEQISKDIDFLTQNPSFSDHFRRRSENTKHTFGNNEDLTLELGGQFVMV